MVGAHWRVVAVTDDVAATSRSEGVVDLVAREVPVTVDISYSGVSGQEATEGCVRGVTEAAPVVDENKTPGRLALGVDPVVAVGLDGVLVLLIAQDARQNDGDAVLLVAPVEEGLDVSTVTVLIPEVGGVVLVALLVGGQCHHGSGESQFVFISVGSVVLEQ